MLVAGGPGAPHRSYSRLLGLSDRRTGGREVVIKTPTVMEHVEAWSHDGKFLIFFSYDDKAAQDKGEIRLLFAWQRPVK